MKKDQCVATCFEWAGEHAGKIICIKNPAFLDHKNYNEYKGK